MIFCDQLEAELLSIAGVHLVAEEIDPKHQRRRARVELEDERLVIRTPALSPAGLGSCSGTEEGNLARVIVVTSGKGGVGKTTSAAAIATGLALLGKKTVVIDFDVGLRNLDLIMGCERRVVFDFINVINDGIRLQPGADQGQAGREPVRPADLADPRQGRARPARASRRRWTSSSSSSTTSSATARPASRRARRRRSTSPTRR